MDELTNVKEHDGAKVESKNAKYKSKKSKNYLRGNLDKSEKL
jgi:hypothetical protein